jgi:hypothetical protein
MRVDMDTYEVGALGPSGGYFLRQWRLQFSWRFLGQSGRYSVDEGEHGYVYDISDNHLRRHIYLWRATARDRNGQSEHDALV